MTKIPSKHDSIKKDLKYLKQTTNFLWMTLEDDGKFGWFELLSSILLIFSLLPPNGTALFSNDFLLVESCWIWGCGLIKVG